MVEEEPRRRKIGEASPEIEGHYGARGAGSGGRVV